MTESEQSSVFWERPSTRSETSVRDSPEPSFARVGGAPREVKHFITWRKRKQSRFCGKHFLSSGERKGKSPNPAVLLGSRNFYFSKVQLGVVRQQYPSHARSLKSAVKKLFHDIEIWHVREESYKMSC